MPIKNRNLFRITRFLLLRLPVLLNFFAKFRAAGKKILIIKTDAIGDYILFRNFIGVLKCSEKYQGYELHLLGNTLWQDIALKYDAAFIDQFYFTKPDVLYEAPLKVLKLGWQLYKNNYQTVLQPSYTRTFINDGLAGLTAAAHIIGFESDNESIAPIYKQKTDRFYTQLLVLPPLVRFEFHRSRFFFNVLLDKEIQLKDPSISTDGCVHSAGIVIFPGAGVAKRSWEKEKFLELIRLIGTHTSQTIYLAGGPGEAATGDYMKMGSGLKQVVDLTGKTSLPELVALIGSATLLIANETSAIHIAAAVKTPAVAILGGGHFERFAPYPDDMENAPVCVYQKMDCYYCNWNCIYQTGADVPFPCIGNISVDSVWQEVKALLSVHRSI